MQKEIVPPNPNAMKVREKRIVQTSIIGIIGNALLVGVKALFGILSGSIAILMDALNNLTDALSSIITIIGTKLSGKAPDRKHPFGHGRIEYLTTMIIAVIILVAGLASISESIQSLVDLYSGGGKAVYENLTLIAIAIAVLFKIGLGLFFRYRGKKYDSDVLSASGVDALWDAVLSFSTLVCALIARFAGVSLEGYFGILIGLFILKSGFEIIRESANKVLGSRTEKDLVHDLKTLIGSFPEVEGVYDLIINEYGKNEANGSVHIQVRDDMDAKTIHALTKKISGEAYLQKNVLLTVGIYASNGDDEESQAIKAALGKMIQEDKNILQMHGFYVDKEKKLITFDLIFDFEERNPSVKCAAIQKQLEQQFPGYQFFIVIDRDYSE
ncbi:MAG: cation transporter [Bacilli bacterium]|nr:cation transporter [Bacilli bacterium]